MTRYFYKMSDSSFSSNEECGNFDYENCIVTQNGDSDDAVSSIFSFHLDDRSESLQDSETKPCETDNDDYFMDITSAHVEAFELTGEDFFVFMLGMFNRIEKYFINLDEGNHKEWLQKRILLLKSLLLKNSALFQINEIKDINGTIYFKTSSPEKCVKDEEASGQLVTDEVEERTEPCLQSEAEINTDDVKPDDIMELNHNSKLKCKPSEVNCRRSERIQNIPEDRKGLCADKMAYISAKLDSYISNSSKTPNTKNCNKIIGQQKKTKNLADNEAMRNNIKKIIQRKTKSLGMDCNRNVKCEATTSGLSSKKLPKQKNDKKVRVGRKRPASLGGGISKKARKTKDEVTYDEAPVTSQPDTTNLTNSAKRKLYSKDAWLDTLGTFFQETPPNT